MYGLPSGFDASRFVGCMLEQVSFSVNTIHLSFSKNASITTESCFAHSLPGEACDSGRAHVPVCDSRLMQLLGESIECAEASSDGTLSLRFANGHRLVFYDDTPQYEAYRIRLGGGGDHCVKRGQPSALSKPCAQQHRCPLNSGARHGAARPSAVERRRVRREVILSAAVSFMLIQWTRGRSRTPLPIHATTSVNATGSTRPTVEYPGMTYVTVGRKSGALDGVDVFAVMRDGIARDLVERVYTSGQYYREMVYVEFAIDENDPAWMVVAAVAGVAAVNGWEPVAVW